MINIIKNVNLIEHVEEYDVVLFGSNLYCTLGDYFQEEVFCKYLYVYEGNLRSKYGDYDKLGTMMECSQEGNPTFTILYITRGYEIRKKGERNDFLNYDALRTCLEQINERYVGKKIAANVLGCNKLDGNGDKERVLAMMEEVLTDVEVDVYDYREISAFGKYVVDYKKIVHLKDTDYKKFKKELYKIRNKGRQRREKLKEFRKNLIM
ncbi:MAG: hypothetical protein IKT40_08915 [Bacilli bacterium]|nr:hypothetical protein [Bacilli bacterium]